MDANVTQDPEAGIFDDARAALVYALTYRSPQTTSLAVVLQKGPLGRAHGLAGFAAAGQAGMILAQLARRPDREILALVLSSMNHNKSCHCGSPCCSGWRPDPVWTNAAVEMGDYLHEDLAGRIMYRAVRQALIERYFGYRRITLEEIAERCAISKRSVEEHAACVNRALKELKGRSWHAFAQALTEAGYLLVSDYPPSGSDKK